MAFTNDLDFDGDGVEEEYYKGTGSRRPELAAAERARLEAEKLAKEEEKKKAARKAQLDGLNNQAFVDDEELLLASGLVDEEKLTEPRVTVEASTTVKNVGAKPPDPTSKTSSKPGLSAKTKIAPKPPSDIGVFSNTRSRPLSARKRIGSAKRNIPRFTMTFSDLAPLTPIIPKAEPKHPEPLKENKIEESEVEIVSEDEEKWAEKKSRRKNKVSPTGSAENEGIKASKHKDDSELGMESGSDNTRKEVEEKDINERPKTAVASEKMKNWSTGEVGNINSILPWDKDHGDIL